MEIIESRKGKLLMGDITDAFDTLFIQCDKKHSFEILTGDLKNGEWCDICDDEIVKIFDSFNLVIEKNVIIQDYDFDYRFEQKSKRYLLYFDREDKEKNLELKKVAYDNNYKVIILNDVSNLKEKIWKAISKNSKFTHIEEDEDPYNVKCTKTKRLNEKSLIKSNPKAKNNDTVGYIRVSTMMQVQDGFSLEAQEDRIYRRASSDKKIVSSLYIDKGVSGKDMKRRFALKELLANIKSGMTVITPSISRLGRNTRDTLSIIDDFKKKEVHFIILDLSIDVMTPAGNLILTLMASQAQFERELTSERIKEVMARMKELGKLRHAPCYGKKLNPDWVIGNEGMYLDDEEEMETIKRILALRLAFPDLSIYRFLKKVEEVGIKPMRKCKKWKDVSLQNLLARHGMIEGLNLNDVQKRLYEEHGKAARELREKEDQDFEDNIVSMLNRQKSDRRE